MIRSDLCASVAARSSLPEADVAAALGALTSTIAAAFTEGETVTVAEFRKFATRTRAARRGRNPRTGEPVAVTNALPNADTVTKATVRTLVESRGRSKSNTVQMARTMTQAT